MVEHGTPAGDYRLKIAHPACRIEVLLLPEVSPRQIHAAAESGYSVEEARSTVWHPAECPGMRVR
jgi:hypothetical protein